MWRMISAWNWSWILKEFAPDGADFLYRPNGTGPQFRVSAAERDLIIERQCRETRSLLALAVPAVLLFWPVFFYLPDDAPFVLQMSIILTIAGLSLAALFLVGTSAVRVSARILIGHVAVAPALTWRERRSRESWMVNVLGFICLLPGGWIVFGEFERSDGADDNFPFDLLAIWLLAFATHVFFSVQKWRDRRRA